MPLPAPVGLLYWYTTSVILAILTLVNILGHLYAFLTRPSRNDQSTLPLPVTAPTEGSPSTTMDSKHVDKSIDARLTLHIRIGRTVKLVFEKYILGTALPLPALRFWVKRAAKASTPTSELGVSIAHAAITLILSFWGKAAWDVTTFSNQTAWIAVAQIPMIIALAGKNNVISVLTGIAPEKLNFLHRSAGRVCVACIWIHSIGHWTKTGGFSIATWHETISQWGATGLIAFSSLYAFSIPVIRRRLYEFFLVVHICSAALAIAASIMHWHAMGIWLWPGIGLWAADRILRMLRLVVLNRLWTVLPTPTASTLPSTCSLTLLTPSTLLVSFETPSPHLKWSAGQHFYVIMPGMSRLPWEAHPFTAATIPHSDHGATAGELTFIVRVRDGFTKRMKDAVDAERKALGLGVEEQCKIRVKAAVEGPYGEKRDMSHYDAVLILSGGSGISYAMAHLMQIIKDSKAGKSKVKTVRIVWMVKSRLHLSWISPILLAHAHTIPPSLKVSLHIHVTKHYFPRALPATSALPNDPTDAEASDLQKYLNRFAAEPPRGKSRLMSTMSWATFTGAWDADNDNGPGTRRGSMAVLPVPASQLTPAKKFPRAVKDEGKGDLDEKLIVNLEKGDVDLEKGDYKSEKSGLEVNTTDLVVVPTFTWSEGYQGNTMPVSTSPVSEFGAYRLRTRRLASEVPSFAVLSELEDEDPVPQRARRISMDTPIQFGSSSRIRQLSHDTSPITPSPLGSGRSRRRSIDPLSTEQSPYSTVRSPPLSPAPILIPSRPSLEVAPRSPPDVVTRTSLEGATGASTEVAVRPSLELAGTRPSLDSATRTSLEVPRTPPRSRQMSITIDEPDHPRRSRPGSPVGSRRPTLLHPVPRRASNLLNVSLHTANTTYLPGGVSMVKSASQQSNLSISTIPIPSPSPLGSGALTPALSRAENNFAETAPERRRQSIGLESIIHWAEGRADLKVAVEELMAEVSARGPGGWVSVNACGPRSLLDSARETVREVSSIKDSWEGKVNVEFRAETFGW